MNELHAKGPSTGDISLGSKLFRFRFGKQLWMAVVKEPQNKVGVCFKVDVTKGTPDFNQLYGSSAPD